MPDLPRYKCHKEVFALKIKAIEQELPPRFSGAICRGSQAFGTACGKCERCAWEKNHPGPMCTLIVPEEEGYLPFEVEHEFMMKHKPEVGGYFVLYADGYKSFSPAQAFEEGYTLISPKTVLDARRMCPPGSEPLA